MHNKRMTIHEDWYYNTVNGDTEKAASLRAGITTSTLNRQLAKGTLSEGNVIAIARAYGQNPVVASPPHVIDGAGGAPLHTTLSQRR